MLSFNKFITEIYMPVGKRDVKWLSDDNERLHSFNLPSGHQVHVGVSVHPNLHTFSYSVDDAMSRDEIDAPKLPVSDHKHIKQGVIKAFNHYIQHKLPVGHTLKLQSLAYDSHEKESKSKLYNTVIGRFLKTSPENKFEHSVKPTYSKAGFQNVLGDEHLIKKLG